MIDAWVEDTDLPLLVLIQTLYKQGITSLGRQRAHSWQSCLRKQISLSWLGIRYHIPSLENVGLGKARQRQGKLATNGSIIKLAIGPIPTEASVGSREDLFAFPKFRCCTQWDEPNAVPSRDAMHAGGK